MRRAGAARAAELSGGEEKGAEKRWGKGILTRGLECMFLGLGLGGIQEAVRDDALAQGLSAECVRLWTDRLFVAAI